MNRLITPYLPLLGQIFRFGMVGLIAAGIHFGIVVWMVQAWHVAPLLANIFGFSTGFQVSYWGHRWWTFSGTTSLHRTAFPKLLFIQIINFAANEALFSIFLSFKLSYPVALILVLAILPLFTFISSKLWVFRQS